jgi:hypothetical protein
MINNRQIYKLLTIKKRKLLCQLSNGMILLSNDILLVGLGQINIRIFSNLFEIYVNVIILQC